MLGRKKEEGEVVGRKFSGKTIRKPGCGGANTWTSTWVGNRVNGNSTILTVPVAVSQGSPSPRYLASLASLAIIVLCKLINDGLTAPAVDREPIAFSACISLHLPQSILLVCTNSLPILCSSFPILSCELHRHTLDSFQCAYLTAHSRNHRSHDVTMTQALLLTDVFTSEFSACPLTKHKVAPQVRRHDIQQRSHWPPPKKGF